MVTRLYFTTVNNKKINAVRTHMDVLSCGLLLKKAWTPLECCMLYTLQSLEVLLRTVATQERRHLPQYVLNRDGLYGSAGTRRRFSYTSCQFNVQRSSMVAESTAAIMLQFYTRNYLKPLISTHMVQNSFAIATPYCQTEHCKIITACLFPPW
jgi:hypothetical protein